MIEWMRNRNIVDCAGIVSGLVDLCEHLKGRFDKGTMYEIGSFAGESAAVFSYYFREVHCVDPWLPDVICDPRMTFTAEDVERSFDARAEVCGNIRKHKGLSLEVVKGVADDSLDFVYIDGAHDLESVRADIAAWAPKVRPGGFIGGHDYHSNAGSDFHVQTAVDEFFAAGGAYGLQLFGDTSWVGRISRHEFSGFTF